MIPVAAAGRAKTDSYLVMSILDAVRSLWHRRDPRIVRCPETLDPVGLRVNHRFVVTACSRWPERAGCDQDCAVEVKALPEESLVRNIVTNWYRTRECTYCGQRVRAVSGAVVVPALRSPDGTLQEWRDVAPENLPALLETCVAVCAKCELAESFRHDFPHLVTDRAATPLRNKAIY